MRVLELFSGTGSVGDVARSMGHRVTSVDNDDRFTTTICTDILKLDYMRLPVPDFIWASPPCTTYSYAAVWFRHRDEDGRAVTADARHADRLLRHTLKIIRYFQGKNPRLKFCIENPRGYMQKQGAVRDLIRTTTSYNQYGYPVFKPTDLFSNFPLDLPPAERKATDLRICGSNTVEIRDRIAKIKGKDEPLTTMLGRIPARLVRRILTQARQPNPRRYRSAKSSAARSGRRRTTDRRRTKRRFSAVAKRSTARRRGGKRVSTRRSRIR